MARRDAGIIPSAGCDRGTTTPDGLFHENLLLRSINSNYHQPSTFPCGRPCRFLTGCLSLPAHLSSQSAVRILLILKPCSTSLNLVKAPKNKIVKPTAFFCRPFALSLQFSARHLALCFIAGGGRMDDATLGNWSNVERV
jgi:hypothetical protein